MPASSMKSCCAASAALVVALIFMLSCPSEARHILQGSLATLAGQGSALAPVLNGITGTPGTPGTPGVPGAASNTGTSSLGALTPTLTSLAAPYIPSGTTSPSTSSVTQWLSQAAGSPTPGATSQQPAASTPAHTTTPTLSSAPAPASVSAPVPSSGSSSVADPVLQGVLDQHNTYRALHQVPALTWSTSLQASAQSWANGCVFAHSDSGNGENIAWGYSTFTAAVDAWYNENTQYNYASGGFSEATGHFTQMVWQSTTSLGCAVASCSQPFYVCQYSPPGNVIGQFQQNVFPAAS